LVERFDERPVWGAHLGVAGAVEHEDPVGRRLGGELAHQPTLAGSGLPAEQRDPAFVLHTPHQRAKALQLSRAADELERRGESERAGKVVHATLDA
jgi:hypothetical protein